MSADEVCIREAARLRKAGLAPIPTVRWKGHCPITYCEHREAGGMPRSVFDSTVRDFKAHGIQCFTGAQYDNVVIDLDSPPAIERWASWCGRHGCPETPKSFSPRGGIHLWFRLPSGVHEVPSCFLWKGQDKHTAIEVLADKQQARCYPSYKLLDGRKVLYQWEPGRTPHDFPRAELPGWCLDLIFAVAPRREEFAGIVLPEGVEARRKRAEDAPGMHMQTWKRLPDWQEVRDAIPDKVELAKQWGVRIISGKPNSRGWAKCRSIFRDDKDPSARFHVGTGGYWEDQLGIINFFALAVAVGAYPDFKSAIEDLTKMAGLDRRAS
jgi:hypothetical protein